jgi:hypothetical protein
MFSVLEKVVSYLFSYGYVVAVQEPSRYSREEKGYILRVMDNSAFLEGRSIGTPPS